jgi:hypothetical protein
MALKLADGKNLAFRRLARHPRFLPLLHQNAISRFMQKKTRQGWPAGFAE